MDLSELSCIILFIYPIISTGPCTGAAALRLLPAACGSAGAAAGRGRAIITGAGTGTGAWRRCQWPGTGRAAGRRAPARAVAGAGRRSGIRALGWQSKHTIADASKRKQFSDRHGAQ